MVGLGHAIGQTQRLVAHDLGHRSSAAAGIILTPSYPARSGRRSIPVARARMITLAREENMLDRTLAILTGLIMMLGHAQAQEVKVGVVLPYTGVGAELGQQQDRGMELYLRVNAEQVKPYTITLIKRDYKDPGGANAKIAVQELLTQDKVDVLGGWNYSPNAIATAPIVTAGRKLAVISNAGTAHITNLSPYYVRTSFSMWHAGHSMGEAAAKQLNAKT